MSRMAMPPATTRTTGQQFGSPRDFLAALIRHVSTGRTDPRLAPFLHEFANGRAASAGTDENQTQAFQFGGAMVPTYLLPGFRSVSAEKDPIGPRVMQVQMPGPICTLPARNDMNHTSSVAGGVSVARREETGLINTSLLEMQQIRLEAQGLWGAAFATNELMLSSAESFAAVLSRAFQDEMTGTLIKERLYGTGAGQFRGVMNSPCLIAVPKDGGQPTATISANNVVQMRSSCWGYDEAIWLANHDAYPQIATLALVAGDGSTTMLFSPSRDEGAPDFLASRPIYFTEYCQPVGSQGDMILGNWSQYLEGTYQAGQASSLHVRYLQHESVFKFWVMNDACPWWLTTLTPQNSTKVLSPFVTLQARP
jgi:HK97 family phage major capsid protein